MTAVAAPPVRPIVFPPVVPASGFLLGVLLGRLLPLERWVSPSVRSALHLAGFVPLALGLAGFAWMVRTMRAAHTPIHNAKTPTQLVEVGPFRFTRNPMYLFGSVAYFGMTLVLFQPWSLALLPFVLLVTHHGVVLREEALLRSRFGEAYERYMQRVPRWL